MKNILSKLFFLGIILSGLRFNQCFAGASIKSTAPGGDVTTGYQGTLCENVAFSPKTLAGHMILKNGMATSLGPIVWDGDGIVSGALSITGSGSLQLNTDLRLGSTATFNTSGSPYMYANGCAIHTESDLLMAGYINTNGSNLVIDGHGHKFVRTNTFYSDTAGATITFKNMVLTKFAGGHENVITQNINQKWENVVLQAPQYVIPSSSSYNSAWSPFRIMDYADFLTLTIQGFNSIEGTGARIIPSGNQSTIYIKKNSVLRIGRGVVFDLSVQTVTITMEDATSVLWLDGCTLYTGSDGLTLKKGTVIMSDKVTIKNGNYTSFTANTDMSKALKFGDGTTAANNCTVKVMGGAYVIMNGCMYNNNA